MSTTPIVIGRGGIPVDLRKCEIFLVVADGKKQEEVYRRKLRIFSGSRIKPSVPYKYMRWPFEAEFRLYYPDGSIEIVAYARYPKPWTKKMPNLQDFAEEHFGLRLTSAQLKMIEAWTDNKVIIKQRQMGLATANKITRAYLKEALK